MKKEPSSRAGAVSASPDHAEPGEFEALRRELAETRVRLAEAEETLLAIRTGEVDALVVEGAEGERVFTLTGAETTYRFLVEEMSEGALLLGTDGTILYANNRFAGLVEEPLERVVGRPWEEFFMPGDGARLAGLLAGASTATQWAEVRVRSGAGGSKPAGVSVCSMKREQVQGFSVVVGDLSERKAAEAELRKANESLEARTARLQELVAELEHFSYTITHDLKAPLRAMKGFAEMMSVTCGECERTQPKEFLARISTSAERMECLITDALNYSRAVRQELPLTDVDTGALLEGMLDTYPEFQAWRAQIRVEGRLPVVLGNEAGLTQCFSNLLGNAVKFVRPGERPQVRVWAEVLADGHREGWVRIWVEDKGIGISREMLPRVFEMFSRGGGGYEGTGIGLALVRKVTQRMGGRAGVESEEGKGSRFWIEVKAGELRARPEKAEAAPAGPKGATVLYVEDEEGDALFMKRAFADKGLESALRVVGDGRAAIEYLSGAGKYGDRREYPLPSAVLLDLNLPQVGGFEVLRWMRNHPDFARTPVVVFSSSTREDDRVTARELGANEFVSKPSSGLKFGEVVEGLQGKWMARGREMA